MALININNLSLSFTDKEILNNISFSLEPHDKLGLIGANGAGKSTLFKLLRGELYPTEGNISISKNLKFGIMEQHACADSKLNVFDETLTVFKPLFEIENEINRIRINLDENSPHFNENIEKLNYLNVQYERLGGLTYLSRTKSALNGLGFSNDSFARNVQLLSGGEKSKLSLCKLLLSDADVLLLDEPTNHLDIKNIEWMEAWLADYKGTFIVISHDRYFLDKVTNKTIELERGKLYSAGKSYSGYIKIKAQRKLSEEREYNAKAKEIKRIEGIIEQQRRFNREKNYITIASKQKQIDRISESLVKPDAELREIQFSFKTDLVSGNDVLDIYNLSKSFDDNLLFHNVNLDIKRGEHCFIIGENGCGKSTLLKIILNKTIRDSGRITLGTGLKIGYFDQALAEVSSSKTVIDEVWDDYRTMTETQIRNALAQFLFTGDDVFKNMKQLSGGEKAKVALLKLMLSKANFLILDEPTNNLDISSRQVLEDALKDYDGTLLIVSHDRYFINALSTKICFLNKNGLNQYIGNYNDYIHVNYFDFEPNTKKMNKSNSYKAQKEFESSIRKLKGKISRTEQAIEETERAIEILQEKLNYPEIAGSYQKIMEVNNEMQQFSLRQNELLEEWANLNEEMERVQNNGQQN